MRVLYSAFACDPFKGSEAQCGWAWVEAMKDYHEVHVLTRKENKEHIESYVKQKNLNITAHFCDIPKWMNPYNMYGKGYFLYYYLWQKTAYYTAKRLHKKHKFDVIHHVSLGDMRIIGSMWKLNTKFVFGPCGGGQVTPGVLRKYVESHIKEEKKKRAY